MKNKTKCTALGLILFNLCHLSMAQNPIIQTCYTADPAPMVHNGTVYLYADHDEDNSKYYTMNDWKVYSSTDMVNWTDHGTPLRYTDFKWSDGQAWASQCVYRNGKYYWYVCCHSKTLNHHAVGVAVSDSPYGPFKDALGKPLASLSWADIDPTVFIDDDGQAYLYWGNSGLWYVKLNKDMISYSGDIVKVDVKDKKAFAPIYVEAPWLNKHNGVYYLSYAAGGIPEHIAYSTSNSPTGPWKYQGVMMPQQGGSFTNHGGMIDFKGKSYYFYHNGALPGGSGFTRSICVDPFTYNSNGTISPFNMTKEGVKDPVGYLNPYKRVEAETMAWSERVKTAQGEKTRIYVTSIDNGDYIKVRSVNFGKKEAKTFAACVEGLKGGIVELRMDQRDGPIIGTLKVPANSQWMVHRTLITGKTAGIHDLYLVFKGKQELFNFDYWQFDK